MVQKCSYLNVLEIFFKEPTKIHFIREISRKISLAPTSVRNYIQEMENKRLIIKKEAEPFNGFIANRENEDFISLKQVYNLYSLVDLKKAIIQKIGPRTLILFGSYQRGEDIENSDVDILIVSKIKNGISLERYEKNLLRKIHITFVKDINDLDENLISNIKNGWVLYGRF